MSGYFASVMATLAMTASRHKASYEPLPGYDPANPNTRLAKMDHITSERPLTKRQKRRLRGKAKGRK